MGRRPLAAGQCRSQLRGVRDMKVEVASNHGLDSGLRTRGGSRVLSWPGE
jgi:hypothetical protein